MSADLGDDLNELEWRDFPNVKFWFRSDWSRFKTNNPKSKIFIETEEGTIVLGARINAIRKCARNFWDGLRVDGAPPPTWGQATSQTKNQYHSLMRKNFPELKLCHNNWKSELLATSHYSPWYHYWVLQKGADSDKLNAEIPKRPKKRQKTESVSGISPFYCYFLLIFPLVDNS